MEQRTLIIPRPWRSPPSRIKIPICDECIWKQEPRSERARLAHISGKIRFCCLCCLINNEDVTWCCVYTEQKRSGEQWKIAVYLFATARETCKANLEDWKSLEIWACSCIFLVAWNCQHFDFEANKPSWSIGGTMMNSTKFFQRPNRRCALAAKIKRSMIFSSLHLLRCPIVCHV